MLHRWRRLRRQKNLPRFLVAQLLRKTGLSRQLLIERSNYRMWFFPTAISAACWVDPEARRGDEIFLEHYLRHGDVVIDVGANVGTFALAAAALVGETGKVFAFEPHPRVHEYLSKNIVLNGFRHVTALNYAVGNQDQMVTISDIAADDDQNHVGSAAGYAVRCVRLDDVLADAPPIALLKIDTEGYERFVMEGASDLLQRTEGVLWEASEPMFRRYGYAVEDIISLLQSQGLTTTFESHGGRIEPATMQNIQASHHMNLVTVRDESAARLERLAGYQTPSDQSTGGGVIHGV